MCFYIVDEYVWCGHRLTDLVCDYTAIQRMGFLFRDKCPGRLPDNFMKHESRCPECSKLPGTGYTEAMKDSMNTAEVLKYHKAVENYKGKDLTPEDKNRREAMESAYTMTTKYHQQIRNAWGTDLSNQSFGSVGVPSSTSNEQHSGLYPSHQLSARAGNSATVNEYPPQPDLLLQQPLPPFQPENLTLDPAALEDIDLLIPEGIFQPTIPLQGSPPNSGAQHAWVPAMAQRSDEEEFFPDFIDFEHAYAGADK